MSKYQYVLDWMEKLMEMGRNPCHYIEVTWGDKIFWLNLTNGTNPREVIGIEFRLTLKGKELLGLDKPQTPVDPRAFDLERAKAGEKVVTRDGRDVTILYYNRKGDCPIVALIQVEDKEDDELITYRLDGRYVSDGEYDYDLLMAEPAPQPAWWEKYERDGWPKKGVLCLVSDEDTKEDLERGEKGYPPIAVIYERREGQFYSEVCWTYAIPFPVEELPCIEGTPYTGG